MFKNKTYKPLGSENNTADPNDDWQKQQEKLQKQQEAARLAEQKRAEAERIKEQNRLAEEQRKAAEQAAQKQAEQAEKDRQKMIVQQEREQQRAADKLSKQQQKQKQSHEMYPRTRSEPLDHFDAKLRDLESPTMTNNRLHLESAQIMGMTDVSPEDFGAQQQAYFKTLERNVADEDLDQQLAQMEGPDNARARKSRELSQKLWPHENGMGQYMQSKTGVTDAIRMYRKAALKEYEDKAVDDEVNTRMAKWREDMDQAESDARFATQAGAEVSKTPAPNTNPTFEDAVNAAADTADTTDQIPPVQYADASNQTDVMTNLPNTQGMFEQFGREVGSAVGITEKTASEPELMRPPEGFTRPSKLESFEESDTAENAILPGRHQYNGLNAVCKLGDPGCTVEKVTELLYKHGVHPNQTKPFVPGEDYMGDVDIYGPWGKDHVTSKPLYDENGRPIGVQNQTVGDHILHPGYVERRVVEHNGQLHILTEGGGDGWFGKPNILGDDSVWGGLDNQILERFKQND